MLDNYPVCLKVIRINIQGGEEDENGETSDFGKVRYYLSNDKYKPYTEEGLCDTFDELRDRVYSEAMRENVEED